MAKSATRPGRKQLSETEKLARKEALKNEPKGAKFIRLALPRMKKALASVKQLGNLSSSQYEYTPDQIAKMRKAVIDQVDETFDRFSKSGSKQDTAFQF